MQMSRVSVRHGPAWLTRMRHQMPLEDFRLHNSVRGLVLERRLGPKRVPALALWTLCRLPLRKQKTKSSARVKQLRRSIVQQVTRMSSSVVQLRTCYRRRWQALQWHRRPPLYHRRALPPRRL